MPVYSISSIVYCVTMLTFQSLGMEEYNRLEVNLAETAAVDDNQEEIIVLEQYQPHSDPHNVLSITDDRLRDPMLGAAGEGGLSSGLSSELVCPATATAPPSWMHRCDDEHDTNPHHVVIVHAQGGEEEQGPSRVKSEDVQEETSQGMVVVLPSQTESEVSAVPEAIAMETVVTTQLPTLSTAEENLIMDQFMVYELSQQAVTEPEVLYVQSALKDQKKRLQDKMKKQELRKDPAYRAKERVKCRQRMQRRREDPGYREREREKDRLRREFVRRNNPLQREVERERDRNAKRLNRTISREVSFLDVAPFLDTSSLADMSGGGSDVT